MKNNPVPVIEQTYKSIKAILKTARSKSFKAVNVAMVQAYWHIGKVITGEEQKGAERSGFRIFWKRSLENYCGSVLINVTTGIIEKGYSEVLK